MLGVQSTQPRAPGPYVEPHWSSWLCSTPALRRDPRAAISAEARCAPSSLRARRVLLAPAHSPLLNQVRGAPVPGLDVRSPGGDRDDERTCRGPVTAARVGLRVGRRAHHQRRTAAGCGRYARYEHVRGAGSDGSRRLASAAPTARAGGPGPRCREPAAAATLHRRALMMSEPAPL